MGLSQVRTCTCHHPAVRPHHVLCLPLTYRKIFINKFNQRSEEIQKQKKIVK